jgi:hypothetical protein
VLNGEGGSTKPLRVGSRGRPRTGRGHPRTF